jgi:hypothetical protein
MLPDYLHIGSAKAASTWLYQICLEHPEIYTPPNNDNINFFLVHYHKGLNWYKTQYFSEWKSEKVGGEFSNSYLLSDVALRRIARDLPEVRLTCILRNPVERAYLHWAHSYYKSGRAPADPETDSGNPLDILPERSTGQLFGIPLDVVRHPNGWMWCRMWLEPGLYAAHLTRIEALFPDERLYVMLYDDLCADPEGLAKGFFEFLGVDSSFRPDSLLRDINPDTEETDPAALSEDMRSFLRDFYRSDIEELAKMIGRDLSNWK